MIYSGDFVYHLDGRKGKVVETFHYQGEPGDRHSALVQWTDNTKTRVLIATLVKLEKHAAYDDEPAHKIEAGSRFDY